MVGFRQNNIFNRWLARWEKDIVTKEHISSHGIFRHSNKRTYWLRDEWAHAEAQRQGGCAKKGLTQRRGEKEAARGFLNLNLRSSNGWPVIKGIDVGAGLRAGPPVWNKRYMQYEMPTYRWHAMATPCTHNHNTAFSQPLYRATGTNILCTHGHYATFSKTLYRISATIAPCTRNINTAFHQP